MNLGTSVKFLLLSQVCDVMPSVRWREPKSLWRSLLLCCHGHIVHQIISPPWLMQLPWGCCSSKNVFISPSCPLLKSKDHEAATFWSFYRAEPNPSLKAIIIRTAGSQICVWGPKSSSTFCCQDLKSGTTESMGNEPKTNPWRRFQGACWFLLSKGQSNRS